MTAIYSSRSITPTNNTCMCDERWSRVCCSSLHPSSPSQWGYIVLHRASLLTGNRGADGSAAIVD